jgi:hypothetical protein
LMDRTLVGVGRTGDEPGLRDDMVMQRVPVLWTVSGRVVESANGVLCFVLRSRRTHSLKSTLEGVQIGGKEMEEGIDLFDNNIDSLDSTVSALTRVQNPDIRYSTKSSIC